MQVFHQFGEIPANFGDTVVTVGNFDGVHRAHTRVLQEIAARAKELGCKSVAVTFDPHPARFLRPDCDLKLITPPPEKLRLMQNTGIDAVLLVPFTTELSLTSPHDFAARLLQKGLRAREVHEGFNFRFGHKAAGDIEALKDFGREMGFIVVAYPEMQLRGELVSSSRIRQLLKHGEVNRARHLLGHAFSILSTRAAGRGYGSKFTVPTVNIERYNELVPKDGVYITRTRIGAEHFDSVTNAGNRPTFGTNSYAIESHLFNFHPLELTPETEIEICFLHRLRDEIKFPSVEALRSQIARDVSKAQHYFQLNNSLKLS